MTDRRRYDPRLGDEEIGEDVDHRTSAEHPDDIVRPTRHVRIPSDVAHDSEDSVREQKEGRGPHAKTRSSWTSQLGKVCKKLVPIDFGWIPANFTWSKLKPVIRCAVVCWVSGVLMIIPRTSNMMGQVSHRSPYLPSLNSIRAQREASSSSYVSEHQLYAHICYSRPNSIVPGCAA